MGNDERQAVTAAQAELKHKLATRIAFAATLIVVLLAGLALFDTLTAPTPEPAPAPEALPKPRHEVVQAVRPAAAPAETKPAESSPPAEAKPAEPPPQPEIAARPAEPASSAAPARPVGHPAPPRPPVSLPPVAVAPAVPAAKAPPPAIAPPPPPPVPSAAPVPAPAPARPTPGQPQPAATAPAAHAAIQPPPAAVAPLSAASGWTLQAGVFTNVQRAEELHAKLALNGIPSTLEARVSLGPFRTRLEADAAREKLRTLGIDGVLLPPRASIRK